MSEIPSDNNDSSRVDKELIRDFVLSQEYIGWCAQNLASTLKHEDEIILGEAARSCVRLFRAITRMIAALPETTEARRETIITIFEDDGHRRAERFKAVSGTKFTGVKIDYAPIAQTEEEFADWLKDIYTLYAENLNMDVDRLITALCLKVSKMSNLN
jgi:hypothetical protein